MIGEVIYDVPAGEAQATSLTMSHSFADYEYVDIQYRIFDSQYFVQSARIYNPNGKMISLDWKFNTDWSTSNVYGKCSRYTLNGNTMTVNSDTGYEYLNNQMGGVTHNTYQYQILITKVIGYKQNSAPIIIPDTEYHSGNTYVNSNYISSTGYISSSQKELTFTIIVPKLLTNITSVTVNKCQCLLRGVGGYVNGTSNIDYANTSGYTINTYIAAPNAVTISIIKSSAYSSSTNNTPVNAAFVVEGLQLTFN